MADLLATVTSNLPNYIELVTQLVGTFAIVATMTPNRSDNVIVDFLARIVNFLAANIGKSKNA